MRAHHGPNIGNSATNGLIQGFAGCLGVGIAIVMVIIVLFIFISAGSHG